MNALANNINVTFQQVTSDLQGLLPEPQLHQIPDKYITTVEECEKKLSKLNVHKAMGVTHGCIFIIFMG